MPSASRGRGGPPAARGSRALRRRSGWHCRSCGRTSADARRLCGFCLAPEPGAREDAAAHAFDAACMRPGHSRDSAVRLVEFPHGRCYRTVDPTAAEGAGAARGRGKQKGLESAGDASANARDEKGEEEEEEEEEVDCGVNDNDWNEEKPATRRGAEGSSSRRHKYTHFVSLPIGRLAAVRPNATALLDAMRSRCKGQSVQIPVEVLSSAPRLHFTLLMLALPTKESCEMAVECMQTLRDRLRGLEKEKWNVRLGGLHVMPGRNRNESCADVVYMGFRDKQSREKVAALQKMVHQCFAEVIVNNPRAKHENKLLHMTVMNSKWGGQGTDRTVFDASELMQHMRGTALRGSEEKEAIRLECVDLNELSYNTEKEGYTCLYSVEI